MATVLFAAAGASLGAGLGGSVLGLSGAVIGRAVGATLGRSIDQRLLGLGSEAVEVGRIDRFRVMGASEGTAIAKVWGRMRVPGQVIWASPFSEHKARMGGGKGMPAGGNTQFSYSVSLAIALCEGEITGISRIWADATEVNPDLLTIRVHKGSADQLPDPVIEAAFGLGYAPCYRDTAYVVIENMELAPFGNRVPQLSFEVCRQADKIDNTHLPGFPDLIKAVAIIPGTGEYALATEPVNVSDGPFGAAPVNVNSKMGETDFKASLGQLSQELPNCKAVSLVVSWFGNDLRCGHCKVMPKVEQISHDGLNMPWRSGGIGRASASVIDQVDGRPIYGGTPADTSVIQAIRAAQAAGQAVMFYPFILMDQAPGNTLDNPFSTMAGQPALPWRGRITLSTAPGRPGSPDCTAAAKDEVNAFFGTSRPDQFSISGDAIHFSGPQEWSYRRFILHYAHLCKIAGGVEAFCIGSEMRGLTQIRGENHSFPAVTQLRQLAADVRQILGPHVKISYAADWSEYFGYHIGDNVYFHLDPLWSDSNIDFVGIDNYMPLSDWRGAQWHADYKASSIYDLEYLKHGIMGGEGYDWFYSSDESRLNQRRSLIEDGLENTPWVFRYKDIPSWWSNLHYDRIEGHRADVATDWIPQSKPIWFTEYGCAAVDKGANEPNKFLDQLSSESTLPIFSNGGRDDFMQFQYYRAHGEFWSDIANNPESELYTGRMIDTNRLFAWAWDARPFPEFPRNTDLWSDGVNYSIGHWINGRVSSVPLRNLVSEVAAIAGIEAIDTERLYGSVSGYAVNEVQSARAILQPLGAALAFDIFEDRGGVRAVSRGGASSVTISSDEIALTDDFASSVELIRIYSMDNHSSFRLSYVSADGNYSVKVANSIDPHVSDPSVVQTDAPLTLAEGCAKSIVDRWRAEFAIGKDVLKMRLPASCCDVTIGSIVRFSNADYRVDRVEIDDGRTIEAVRVDASHYIQNCSVGEQSPWVGFKGPSPVGVLWMDLPLFEGAQNALAPYIALSASRWPGNVAIWRAAAEEDYKFIQNISDQSIIGRTLGPLHRRGLGFIDRTAPLAIDLANGELSSVSNLSLLNGSNAIAIGDGTKDAWEIIQFRHAELVGAKRYSLHSLLRGQSGSDGSMPDVWPSGSLIVVLDASVTQVEVQADFRNVERSYIVGDAAKGYTDANSSKHRLAFKGNGLRPYKVAHLKAKRLRNDDFKISWIRRTRIGGDDWDAYEVPLGEAIELYQLSLKGPNGLTIRTITINKPDFMYEAAQRQLDGTIDEFTVEVSQISQVFGVGPVSRLAVR